MIKPERYTDGSDRLNGNGWLTFGFAIPVAVDILIDLLEAPQALPLGFAAALLGIAMTVRGHLMMRKVSGLWRASGIVLIFACVLIACVDWIRMA